MAPLAPIPLAPFLFENDDLFAPLVLENPGLHRGAFQIRGTNIQIAAFSGHQHVADGNGVSRAGFAKPIHIQHIPLLYGELPTLGFDCRFHCDKAGQIKSARDRKQVFKTGFGILKRRREDKDCNFTVPQNDSVVMEAEIVRDYFDQPAVVREYADATGRVGLWVSEEKVFSRVFSKEDSLLDLGTGAGRIAIGLFEIGYKYIIGVDVSRPMIAEARRIARVLNYGIPFRVGDATRLDFGDGNFDGVIFGFNGLMQIPGRENRRGAMSEVFKVLRPGGRFVFTTHDRNSRKTRKFWAKEKSRWRRGTMDPQLDDFGDRFEPTPLGELYIHVPTTDEIRADLKGAGFRVEADVMRSHVASESHVVREFSDDCRFWVAQRPSGEGGGKSERKK